MRFFLWMADYSRSALYRRRILPVVTPKLIKSSARDIEREQLKRRLPRRANITSFVHDRLSALDPGRYGTDCSVLSLTDRPEVYSCPKDGRFKIGQQGAGAEGCHPSSIGHST